MRTYDTYNLLITPLSPVHIGSGDSYEPTNYVIDGHVLYEFDTEAAMQAMTSQEKDELLKICNGKPGTEMIQSVQRFFHKLRDRLMSHAIKSVPVLPGVASLYVSRVGQIANREAGGKNVINKLEIDRTVFDYFSRVPVLYGSSIKGAIRTALLDSINAGKPTEEKEGLHPFQGQVFRYYDKTSRPPLALERDPMRLVQISDAAWLGSGRDFAAQVYLAVNRKKAPVKDKNGNLVRSRAESAGLYQILECIPMFRYGAFNTQINLLNLYGIGNNYALKVPAIELRFDMTSIAKACNAFYNPILTRENKILMERGYLNLSWYRDINSILEKSKDKMERGEVFLLRIGRHSGAESVTLNGVRRIKINKGKGKQAEFAAEPKTLWLAAEEIDQEENLLPFGWVLVEVYRPIDYPQEWMELKNICQIYSEKIKTSSAVVASTRTSREHALQNVKQVNSIAQPVKIETKTIVWANASLDWNPGNGTLTATHEGKKAYSKNREIVPAEFHDRLFGKKKSVIAKVTVEKDGNRLQIIKIEKQLPSV